jgi:phosphoribosylaminoimidazolecarboxamide formyltransferase/IMP cyclohydrolase
MPSAAFTALLSVSDKQGIAAFARGLRELGFRILSTGGTAKLLRELGVEPLEVSDFSGSPEVMDGRVKTLHPKIHAGILARAGHAGDLKALQKLGTATIDLVAVNLYPFEKTASDPTSSPSEIIEQIDIGGPSLLRAAAKNHERVLVVCDPAQYEEVLTALREDRATPEFRARLAETAFSRTAQYDAAIAHFFQKRSGPTLPERLTLPLRKAASLRYGENPHQPAALYENPLDAKGDLLQAKLLHGPALSFINYLDMQAAHSWAAARSRAAVCIIKHTSPCGAAAADRPADALDLAWEGDPLAAFGAVVVFNRTVDSETADLLLKRAKKLDVLLAPAYDSTALEQITRHPKRWIRELRIVVCPFSRPSPFLEARPLPGGFLVQTSDHTPDDPASWKTATRRAPTPEELREMKFSWDLCRIVKSNAIVVTRSHRLVGVGSGRVSRVDSARDALEKAGDRSRGAVLASEAFLPFRDTIDLAAQAGITAVVQPGGSRKDEETITAADEHGIAMQFTGVRHFLH